MSECDTQEAIIDLIQHRGGLAIRINSGAIRIEGEKPRYFRGAKKGTSDIIALYCGKYLAIEVKSGKNKPTPEQLEFGRRVRDAGGLFLVAYDVDAVISLLEQVESEG